MLAPINRRYLPIAQTALRIAAGMAYFTHGGQKLFGWFGAGGHAQLASRFGVAGVIEVVLGACLVLGLLTQLAAFIASGEMAVAYFWMHVAGSGHLWWWVNHGELPFLYCFIWLVFAAWGGGPFSLDALIARRRAVA